MLNLDRSMSERHQQSVIPFEEFLQILSKNPSASLRNVFQVFYDMIKTYVGEGTDEYPEDPASIHFVNYDCTSLFVDGTDHPFFADWLFANRLINHVEAMRRGAQQNKIYIFDGPPGCGKSTFLNNLLMKFEEYTKTEQGLRYEAVWRLDRKLLSTFSEHEPLSFYDKAVRLSFDGPQEGNRSVGEDFDPFFPHGKQENLYDQMLPYINGDYIEVPCPSHDNPLLLIPKAYRRELFDDLIKDVEFKQKLFSEKQYEWVFRDNPCTICVSLYHTLLDMLDSPSEVFNMVFARRYQFNRRLGEGISVFNPGDRITKMNVMTNRLLQNQLNSILKDSNRVRYIFSRYAKTNNGIYALMDIKDHNKERFANLGIDILLMVDEKRTIFKIAESLGRRVEEALDVVRWCVPMNIVRVECPETQETGAVEIIELPLFEGELKKAKKEHRDLLSLCNGNRPLQDIAKELGIPYFQALQSILPYRGKTLRFIRKTKTTDTEPEV